MDNQKGILRTRAFYCDHITNSARDVTDISSFSVRHSEVADGLGRYLKEQALIDETENMMRTYLVRDITTDELVGYFSLKAGMVSINEREIVNESGESEITFDTAPGIEIANFGINDHYISAHPGWKGIGAIIFKEFIRELAMQSASVIGAKLLYIFALPFDSLIKRYHSSYHFLRLDDQEEDDLHKRLKPFYDRSCIFMYQML